MNQIIVILFLITISTSHLSAQNNLDSMGKRQGLWIITKDNDSLKNNDIHFIKANYVNDTLNGGYEGYDVNEQLRYFTIYDNGKRQAIGYFYDSKSRLILMLQYFNDSIRKVTEFHRNGKPFRDYQIMDGRYHGYFLQFRRSGKLLLSRHYSHGALNGEEIYFRRNGKMRSFFFYERDLFLRAIKKPKTAFEKCSFCDS